MNQDSIKKIKKQAGIIQKAMKFIFAIMIILSFAALVISVILFFSPQEQFTAVKGNLDWSIDYNWTKTFSSGIYIPFSIIQPLDSSMFSAKLAFIIYLLSFALIKIPVILFGISQISNVLQSVADDLTPFVMDNVKRLQRLACAILFYSIAADILISILCCIFVTKIFLINLSTIDITGVIIGGLTWLIADIFKYGVFLQNEFDTTL